MHQFHVTSPFNASGSPEQTVRCEKISQGHFNTVKSGVGKFVFGDTVIVQGKLTREAGIFCCTPVRATCAVQGAVMEKYAKMLHGSKR